MRQGDIIPKQLNAVQTFDQPKASEKGLNDQSKLTQLEPQLKNPFVNTHYNNQDLIQQMPQNYKTNNDLNIVER